MLKKNCILVIVSAFFLMLVSQHQVFAGQATGTASVKIVSSIASYATRELSFGDIAVPKSGITAITLSPEEYTQVSGNGNYGGEQASARFEVKGIANSSYMIVLPSDVQIAYDSNYLTLNNFTHNYGSSPGLIKADGEDVFYVGATLNVPENTIIGFYTGTFAVMVDYQ